MTTRNGRETVLPTAWENAVTEWLDMQAAAGHSVVVGQFEIAGGPQVMGRWTHA